MEWRANTPTEAKGRNHLQIYPDMETRDHSLLQRSMISTGVTHANRKKRTNTAPRQQESEEHKTERSVLTRHGNAVDISDTEATVSQEDGFYEVEKFVDWMWANRARTKKRYLVRWAGFEGQDSWEPEQNLSHLKRFQEFVDALNKSKQKEALNTKKSSVGKRKRDSSSSRKAIKNKKKQKPQEDEDKGAVNYEEFLGVVEKILQELEQDGGVKCIFENNTPTWLLTQDSKDCARGHLYVEGPLKVK